MSSGVNKTEEVILNKLKERYQDNIYHTWAADVLLILKPPVDGGTQTSQNRRHPNKLSEGKDSKNNHIYSFSKSIYEALVSELDEDLCDQSVILRGISGSGKTEACKELVTNLVQLHCNDDQLKLKINNLFSVIEAFGNARTSSNKNSSRCAFTHTLYFQTNKLVGINLTQLQYDPWRLVDQSEGSSNFHVFYYALAGFQDGPVHKLVKSQSIMSQQDLDGYRNEYRSLLEALNILGFSVQERKDTMLLLKMILTLGDVTFRRSKFGDVVLDGESKNYIKSTAEMVGLDEDDLEKCLCYKTVCISNEEVIKHFTRDEAEDFLAFLLWTIYSKIFSWLVQSINLRLSPIDHASKFRHIRVIDFPGREISKINSLEEFMINVSDDILHYSFVQNYSNLIEDDYLQDDLEWIPTNLIRNSELAKMLLLLGPLIDSILISLNEDKTAFSAESITNNLSLEQKKYIQIDSKRPSLFVLTHYDKEQAAYDMGNWREKNTSKLPGNVLRLFTHSENPLLSLLMKAKFNAQAHQQVPPGPELISKPQPKERSLSPLSHLKSSLIKLLKRNTRTTPSFICCINSSSSNSKYDFDFVRKQFEGMGLKDLVYNFKNIHQHCYQFEDFLERYSLLLISSSSSSTIKEQCRDILKIYLTDNNWKIGKSKVFVQQHHLISLNKVMNIKNPNLKDNTALGPTEKSCVYSKPNKQVLVTKALDCLEMSKINCHQFKPPERNVPGSTCEAELLALQSKNIKAKRLYPILNQVQTTDQMVDPKLTTPSVARNDDNDSDSESDFETWNNAPKETKYGEVGARKTSIKWFKTTQARQLMQDNGFYADWFHGIISRRQAEHLLKDKSSGCYLVRVAESRLGFSLSIKDKQKIHHYMIDEVDGGNFKVTGEKIVHQSLKALVEFYKKNKISNWDGHLTVPCSQAEGECNYSDLILSDKDIKELRQAMASLRLEPTVPSS